MNVVQKKSAGRPRKNAANRIADRQTMIDVAVAILTEGGSAALTARGVAERAGTAVGSVYTQFENLEELRLEANAVTMRHLKLVLSEALRTSREVAREERLLCLARAYIRFAAEHHNAWSAMFERRTIEAPPTIAADIAALFAIIEDVLQNGEPPLAVDCGVMARALWSSVHGMVYLGETGGLGPIRQDEILPMIDTLVRAAVRGATMA